MPDKNISPQDDHQAQIAAFLNTLPPELQQNTMVQQFATSGLPFPAFLQQVQGIPEVQAFFANGAQAAQSGDALATLGASIKGQFGNLSFTARNPQTGQEETIAVPVQDVTVHAEMSGGKEQVVFKLHVPAKDTIYETQIAEQALPVIAGLHPDFQPGEKNAAPVRTGSYRDDTSVSLVADVPEGKRANDIVAEILHPELLKAAAPVVVADQSINTDVKAPVTQTTATANAAPVVVNVDCGDRGDVNVTNVATGGDAAPTTFANADLKSKPILTAPTAAGRLQQETPSSLAVGA